MCPREAAQASLGSVSPWPGLAEDTRAESWDYLGQRQTWTSGEALSCLQKSFLTPTSTLPVSWRLPGP